MSDHLKDLEALAHAIPLAKRKELGESFNRLAEALAIKLEDCRHLTWPTPSWPNRGEGGTKDSALRYVVDFGYGDRPDHRDYLASFEEVRKLLNYTRDSCKVAFGTNKGKVDRTQRSTRLGPCVIHRLPAAVDAEQYPNALRLSDREAVVFPAQRPGGKKSYARGNKY